MADPETSLARGGAKVVALVETSVGSLPDAGRRSAAPAALASFLTLLQPGDAFAILHVDGEIHRLFPSSANFAVYGAATAAEAFSQVRELAAGGGASAGETFGEASGEGASFGEAIALGLELLRGQAEPRALVVLSDCGFDPDPRLLDALDPAVGVFTAAFGEGRQRRLLRQMAGSTGGTFLYAPDEIGLASLYFDILEPSRGADRFR